MAGTSPLDVSHAARLGDEVEGEDGLEIVLTKRGRKGSVMSRRNVSDE
jgi:hypothetical protein